MLALELKNVSYEYVLSENEIIKAVDGLSLCVESGEFIAVIGHNGSGKSTLAKLLNGLLLPSTGEVSVFSANTKNDSELKKVRSKVGMVFQNPDNQIIAGKVIDDVAFGPENLSVPRDEIIARVNWALDVVGMSDEKESTPHRLSGGQKQRVAIAGVLALKPEILVLDESTAMLDPAGRAEVMRVAKDLNASGMTVIIITHFMEEALPAGRLLVMNEGKIVADGSPSEIFSNYQKLKDIDLSIPPATQIANELIKAGLNIPKNIMTETELAEAVCKII